jgi:hypothetical protein
MSSIIMITHSYDYDTGIPSTPMINSCGVAATAAASILHQQPSQN